MRHQHMEHFVEALDQLGKYQLTLADVGPPDKPIRVFLERGHNIEVWRQIGKEARGLLAVTASFTQFGRRLLRTYKFDEILIHFVRPHYLPLVLLAKRAKIKVAIALWGSDINRVAGLHRQLVTQQLKVADVVICGEPKLPRTIIKMNVRNENVHVRYYGSGPGKVLVQQMTDKRAVLSTQTPKKRHNKVLKVVIGNSGNPNQRHLEVIDSLTNAFQANERASLHLILPVTYSLPTKHYRQLLQRLNENDWSYDIYTDFISDESMAQLRHDTDVYLNLQPADSFSNSMRESMYLGVHIIHGAWLDYSFAALPSRSSNDCKQRTGGGEYCLRSPPAARFASTASVASLVRANTELGRFHPRLG